MLNKDLLRRRIDFIRQGSEVERFHTKRMIQRNDVGHHSFHVAWLAYLMAEGSRYAVRPIVMAALAHDLAEHITGDMPGDFKREMGIREQFGEYESTRFLEIGFMFEENLTEDETRIVKLADMMDGAFFCISEASFGNARVGVVFRNFRSYIEKFSPFSAVEAEIVAYIDELWTHYGVDSAPGYDKTAHTEASMQDESIIGEENVGSLTGVLRQEQAEGRATPPPTNPSKAAETGDARIPQHLQNDAMDEPDLAPQAHSPANARQVGGDHYKGSGYEHWDLVLDTGMNYFQGCATKYVARARKHEGGLELNLNKAVHYIEKLMEAFEKGRIKAEGVHSVAAIVQFGTANRLNELEVQVIKDIVAWRLENALVGLRALMAGESEPKPAGPATSYYTD